MSQGEGKVVGAAEGMGAGEGEEVVKGKGKEKRKAEPEVSHQQDGLPTLVYLVLRTILPFSIRFQHSALREHSIAMATMTSIMATGTVVHLRRTCDCHC